MRGVIAEVVDVDLILDQFLVTNGAPIVLVERDLNVGLTKPELLEAVGGARM